MKTDAEVRTGGCCKQASKQKQQEHICLILSSSAQVLRVRELSRLILSPVGVLPFVVTADDEEVYVFPTVLAELVG